MPITIKLKPREINNGIFLNQTIQLTPLHLNQYNLKVNIKQNEKIPGQQNQDDLHLESYLLENKSLKCPKPPCQKIIVVNANFNETWTQLVEISEDGNTDQITLITKPGLGTTKQLTDTQYVNDYLQPILNWIFGNDKSKVQSKYQFFFFADQEYEQVYTEHQLNEFFNFLRIFIDKYNQTELDWNNIRLITDEEKETINKNGTLNNDIYKKTDNEIDSNLPNFSDTSNKLDQLLKQNQNCENDCSNNGLCFKSKCYCNQQFSGSDCSLDMSIKSEPEQNQNYRFLKDSQPIDETYQILDKSLSFNFSFKQQQKNLNQNPCYSKGYIKKDSNIIGGGNFKLCREFLKSLYFDENCDEKDKLCIKNIFQDKGINLTSKEQINAGEKLQSIGYGIFHMDQCTLEQFLNLIKNFCGIEYKLLPETFKNISSSYSQDQLAEKCYEMVYQYEILNYFKIGEDKVIVFHKNPESKKNIQFQVQSSLLTIYNWQQLKKKEEISLNIPLVVIGFISLIFLVIMQIPQIKQKILKNSQRMFEKYYKEELFKISKNSMMSHCIQEDIKQEQGIIIAETDLQKDQRKFILEKEMFEFRKRRIACKQYQYLILPFQIIFLVVFLLGLFSLISYSSQNYLAFLVCSFIGFLIVILGVIDIETLFILEVEKLDPYRADKIHNSDIQFFSKIVETQALEEIEENLEPILEEMD